MSNSSRREMRSIRAAYKDLMAGSETEQAKRDKKSAEWILEYVLKHCNDDWIVAELLKTLPISDENLNLKKMMLLKRISSEVSKGSISEKTLDALESIKGLDRHLHNSAIDPGKSVDQISIQELYWDVALECTLKHLRPEITNWDKYNAALRSLWSDRIEDTEDVEKGGWASNKMEEFKKELFAVAGNPELRHTLLGKYRQDHVMKSLKVFLRDAWEKMGPTFLEIVVEDVAKGRYDPFTREAGNVSDYTIAMARNNGERLLEEAWKENDSHEKVTVENEVLMRSPATEEIGVRHMIAGNPIAKSPKHGEETSPTFPPPWTDLHPGPVTNMNKERKRTKHNSRESPSSLSKMRGLLVEDHNGKLLSNRKVPEYQETWINLKENKISGQDASVRKEAAVVSAQNSGRSNVQDLDDVYDQRALRLRTVGLENNRQRLTPEFLKTQKILSKTISELRSRVDDPLPDAIRVAEQLVAIKESLPSVAHVDGKEQTENPSIEVEKNLLQETHEGKVNRGQRVEARGARHQNGRSHSEPLKCSLMDRNPTARTYEWDEHDSMESQREESPSASRRVHLPTPTRREFSPLKRPRTAADRAHRRRHTKWTVIEEDTLKKEVAKYGKGRWKFILEKNREIFEERTEVDLKDKWRNIAKREGLHLKHTSQFWHVS